MKVILLKDVKGTGRVNDIVTVNDGYARNYLIPRGIAQEATTENVNRSIQKRNAQVHRKNMERSEAQEVVERLRDLTVDVEAKAGKDGRLFGSVTASDIAAALKKQHHLEVDKKKIELEAPIKQAGINTATVRVYAEMSARIRVNVIAVQ